MRKASLAPTTVRRHVEENFSISLMANEYVKVYERKQKNCIADAPLATPESERSPGQVCKNRLPFWEARGIIGIMHAEAVMVGIRPSGTSFVHDVGRTIVCEECETRYWLYYDVDAEASCTFWNMLGREIITARHPYHTPRVRLDLLQTF